MKKQLKKGLLVVAALGMLATGGYAAKKVFSKSADEQVYTWTKVGVEQPPFIGTKSQAQDHFGCRGTVDACAIGTPDNPGLPLEVIYQN